MTRVGVLMLTLGLVATKCVGDVQSAAGTIASHADGVPENPTFSWHILPLLNRHGCATFLCHGAFRGQGGFQLSLRGQEVKKDYLSVVDGRIVPDDPRKSLLVLKPTESVEHGGGARFTNGSWEYQLLLKWIELGTPLGDEIDVERLYIEPRLINFDNSRLFRVFAVGRNDARTVEDVTRLVTVELGDPAIAQLDGPGKCRPGTAFGSTSLVVRFRGKTASAVVLAPFPQPPNGGASGALLRETYSAPDPAYLTHSIDRFVFQRLADLRLHPVPLCEDYEFLRRVTFDIAGRSPDQSEVETFLADSNAEKRARKIEELLGSSAYAWRWGSWLTRLTECDEEELAYASGELGIRKNKLAFCWLDWFRTRVGRDEPFDQIVASIVSATSREHRSAAEYMAWLAEWRERLKDGFDDGGWYAQRATHDLYWRESTMIYDSQRPIERLAANFLGIRLECARCHDHPTDRWSNQDFQRFAAITQPIRYSELPLTRSNKRGLLFASAAAVAIAGLMGVGLTWILFRRRRFQIAQALLNCGGIVLGASMGAAASYRHLLGNSNATAIQSPGTRLADALTNWIGATSVGPITLVGICLGASLAIVVLLSPFRLCSTKKWRGAAWCLSSVLIGLGLFTLLDGYVVATSGGTDSREPIAHWAHRRILRSFGLGGSGQQPRELFVAEGQHSFTPQPSLLDGTPLTVSQNEDPRAAFFRWMKSSPNSTLATNIVNRVWAEYFGWGLIEPATSLTDSNPPSHPELLEWLTNDFVAHGYSLKHLHRTITNSRVYQLSSRANDQPALDRHYGRFPPRRLSAEQIVNAIGQLVGIPNDFGDENAPPHADAHQIAMRYPWGNEFGTRALRLLGHAGGARDTHLDAVLFGLVDESLRTSIRAPSGRLNQWIRAGRSEDEILDDLYLTAYCRKPTMDERIVCQSYLLGSGDGDNESSTSGWVDIVWAIINSDEFQINH